MVWLSEISPWTWAAIGLSWVGVSGALALVLGKVLARTNEAAEVEELALARAEAARSLAQPASQFEPAGDWFSQAASAEFCSRAEPPASTDDDQVDEYAGRAASGTRFKPVQLEDEAPQPAPNVRSLRGVR